MATFPTNEISVYRGISPQVLSTVSWITAVETIKSDEYKEIVESLRAIKDPDEYRTAKTKLIALAFGGTFNGRRANDAIQKATGFIVADIDHIPDVQKIFEVLKEDDHVWFVFISPGGDGIKCGLRSETVTCDEDHKQFYQATEEYFKRVYDIEIDSNCKDISRLTFVSWDPDTYINPNAVYFDHSEFEFPADSHPPPKSITTDTNPKKQKYGGKVLAGACEKIRMSRPGDQHRTRIEQATLVGGYIPTGYYDRDFALNSLEQAVADSGAQDMAASMKDITDGLAYGEKRPLDPIGRNNINSASETYQGDRPEVPPESGTTTPGKGAVKDEGTKEKPNIRSAILETEDFLALNLPEKTVYLDPWLVAQSILLISGFRGTGKTWLALSLLVAIAKGIPFGPWPVQNSVPCLYLDGEMAAQDVQLRAIQLDQTGEKENPLYIYSDAYANSLGLPRASLLNPDWRLTMKDILLELGVKVWVIDNLASLTPGIDENSKQDWDPINHWLLDLRFADITTVLLHHTNKSGGQRGTSAREDNIDISAMLSQPSGYCAEDGASFVMSFTKSRVATDKLSKIADTHFQLTLDDENKLVWTYGNVKRQRKQQALILKDKGWTNKEVADELGCSIQNVGQIVNRAQSDGYLTKDEKLSPSGFEYVHRDEK